MPVSDCLLESDGGIHEPSNEVPSIVAPPNGVQPSWLKLRSIT